jgi:hypothetical protein
VFLPSLLLDLDKYCIFIVYLLHVYSEPGRGEERKGDDIMPHQRPKSAAEDAYSYTLDHEIAALIQELADHEADELDLQKLTPSNYLTRLIKREAAAHLDEESQARARARADEKLQRRLQEGAQDPEAAKVRRPRTKKAAQAEAAQLAS